MEKPLGYTQPIEQNNIKGEPEPLIKRVKSVFNNISRPLQEPERNNDKPVSRLEKEMFVNEFTTKILNKAKEFGISKDELLNLSKLS